MAKQKVFLIGATGETGATILDALIKDGDFDITCFIRTSSANKPSAKALRDRGLHIVTGDLSAPVSELATLLKGIDIVVCAIFAENVDQQIPLFDASVIAGVKRFVPCNWGTPSARGGVLDIRDKKENVHDHMFRAKLGYTIIDVGFWYQVSFPRLKSGKFDYAVVLGIDAVNNNGTARNMLIDKRDVGPITVKIIKDPRTLNKRVIVYGEILTQNQIHALIESKSGESLTHLPHKSADDLAAAIQAARDSIAADLTDPRNPYKMPWAQYNYSKYVREDNTPENAVYLGYVDGNELYPEFKYRKFADFVDELVAGKVEKTYPEVKFNIQSGDP